MANEQGKSVMRPRQRTALMGLALAPLTVKGLQEAGIYCTPRVWVVRQRQAQKYVIRAQESGGCVADLGAYCGFISASGDPLPWFQTVETIGVNGLHALAVAESLVRVHVVRVKHTYDVLITKHALRLSDGARQPQLVNSILFKRRQGTLQLELWGKDSSLRGQVCPIFFDAAGEPMELPVLFRDAVARAVAGATCPGCTHSHVLVAPEVPNTEEAELFTAAD